MPNAYTAPAQRAQPTPPIQHRPSADPTPTRICRAHQSRKPIEHQPNAHSPTAHIRRPTEAPTARLALEAVAHPGLCLCGPFRVFRVAVLAADGEHRVEALAVRLCAVAAGGRLGYRPRNPKPNLAAPSHYAKSILQPPSATPQLAMATLAIPKPPAPNSATPTLQPPVLQPATPALQPRPLQPTTHPLLSHHGSRSRTHSLSARRSSVPAAAAMSPCAVVVSGMSIGNSSRCISGRYCRERVRRAPMADSASGPRVEAGERLAPRPRALPRPRGGLAVASSLYARLLNMARARRGQGSARGLGAKHSPASTRGPTLHG